MTFEIVLRPPFSLPRFVQSQENGPRHNAHWIGQRSQSRQNQNEQGGSGRNKPRPKKTDPRGYRDLSTINLGEVKHAHEFFAEQLVEPLDPSWVATNQFCMIHLLRIPGRPSAIFGRIKACYPSDGYIHNIQDMELLFPHKAGPPDTLLLRMEDIRPNDPIQTYCVRVRFLASTEDEDDFRQSKVHFNRQGFFLDFQTGYLDLLETNELNYKSLPWIYIIGSRWFASIPVSIQPEIRTSLANLLRWNRVIFNYHPERLPKDVRTLNRELGFKAGFTDTFLIEPETPAQTLQIAASAFEEIFSQPMR